MMKNKGPLEQWFEVDSSCKHCGEKLAGRQIEGDYIEGIPPIEWRHQRTDSKECIIRYVAGPYDGWLAGREFIKKRRGES